MFEEKVEMISSDFLGNGLVPKDEVNCLVWVERMASILYMKIVQILVRSRVASFVV